MKLTILLLLAATLFRAPAGNAEERSDRTGFLAHDNNAFAFDLYHQLQTRDGNLVFSPYSISTALAMTYGGARGETEEEMATVLHFRLPQDALHEAFHELLRAVERERAVEGLELHVANALWRQEGYVFLDSYLKLLERQYEAEPFMADFLHNAKAARAAINVWVEEQTAGNIVDLIEPGILTPATTLVLANAIYFKGLWAHQFDPEQTMEGEFAVSQGEIVETPMMRQTARFRFRAFDGCSALEIPYVDDELAMVILLPNQPSGIRSLEEDLSGEKSDVWLSELFSVDPAPVRVMLPRFSGRSTFELADVLTAMGMPHAFHGADFSGMTGNLDLFISNVIHEAYVEVNEEGTEAAASTAVVMKRGRIDEFIIDHPFLFLIVEKKTGSIVFLGRIVDPSA